MHRLGIRLQGQPPEQYQVPGLFYFTNDEGLNVVTSNPDDEPVMHSRVCDNDIWGCG